MKCKIEVNMDNAAFEDNGGAPELSRILRVLIDKLDIYGKLVLERGGGTIYDTNGNRVGTLTIEE